MIKVWMIGLLVVLHTTTTTVAMADEPRMATMDEIYPISYHHVSFMKDSPYCSTQAPKDMNSQYYLWPESQAEAYSGRKETGVTDMYYCQTKAVNYVWPAWGLRNREDWFYPLTFVETVGGVLATRGREYSHNLLLNGEPFIADLDYTSIDQAFVEQDGKVKLVIVTLHSASKESEEGYHGRYLVDMSVAPPYVSEQPLQIGTYNNVFSNFGDVLKIEESQHISISQTEEGVYTLSGRNGEGEYREFVYERGINRLRAVQQP